MALHSSDLWYLRKHEDKSIFGPHSFSKLQEWAKSAQIAPNDTLSEDQVNWIKAPMVPELAMDWLVELEENLLYGPTTSEAVMEFYTMKEITAQTLVINCVSAQEFMLEDCAFFPESNKSGEGVARDKKSLLENAATLHHRVEELESLVREQATQLLQLEETVWALNERLIAIETSLS